MHIADLRVHAYCGFDTSASVVLYRDRRMLCADPRLAHAYCCFETSACVVFIETGTCVLLSRDQHVRSIESITCSA